MNKLYTTKHTHGTLSAYIYRIIAENGNGTVTIMPTTSRKENKPVTGLRRAELTTNIHMSELVELRWVYGTRTGEWYLVDESDRDYASGISYDEMDKIGFDAAKAKYLSPALIR